MNRLSTAKRVQVLSALVEGVSINATCRMSRVVKHTRINSLRDLGSVATEYHHRHVRGLRVRCVQCEEIWAFVGAKAKIASAEKKAEGWGDAWTWTAVVADTKLCVSYLVGGRTTGWATGFMLDSSDRIVGRPQIITGAHKPHLKAVEEEFDVDADYAMLHKTYGASNELQRRYSPATSIGCDMKTVSGDPDPVHVSASYFERQNSTMRMSMRRFKRLTNGFSNKLENHGHAVALHFMHYNFLPDSQVASGHASHGSGPDGPRLDIRGIGGFTRQ